MRIIPSQHRIKVGFLWLLGISIFGFGIAGLKGYQETGLSTINDFRYVGLFGLISTVIMATGMLCFVYFPIMAVTRISLRTQERAKRLSDSCNPRRGGILMVWGMRIYLLMLIVLEVYRANETGGKGIWFSFTWLVLLLWMFSSTKQGIKAAKDFISYLLLMGVPAALLAWFYNSRHPIIPYQIAFMLYGSVLGGFLILSVDANCYMADRYQKLPKDLRDKIERKQKT